MLRHKDLVIQRSSTPSIKPVQAKRAKSSASSFPPSHTLEPEISNGQLLKAIKGLTVTDKSFENSLGVFETAFTTHEPGLHDTSMS